MALALEYQVKDDQSLTFIRGVAFCTGSWVNDDVMLLVTDFPHRLDDSLVM